LTQQNTQSIIGRFRGALIDDYRKVTANVREDLMQYDLRCRLARAHAAVYVPVALPRRLHECAACRTSA
jgi:hypothetical protein